MTNVPAGGGATIHAFDLPARFGGKIHFSPDGQALTYSVIDDHGVYNLWAQPLSGGSPKQITDFKSDEIFAFAWSHDGKQLALSRGQTSHDAVLLTDTTK